MPFEAALRALGLRKPAIKLVQFFLANLDKEQTAGQIARATEMSVIRVYKSLAELVGAGLIERRVAGRIVFCMTDPESRFRAFTEAKARQQQETQRTILDTIADFRTKGTDIVLLRNRDEFYRAIYQLFLRARNVKMLARTHWGIVPDKIEEYWRDRAWAALKRRLAQGLELRYLVDEKLLRKDISKSNLAAVRRSMAWLRRQPCVQLRSTEFGSALSTIITESEVLIGFKCPHERYTTKGLIIRHAGFHKFFEDIYDRAFEHGSEVLKI